MWQTVGAPGLRHALDMENRTQVMCTATGERSEAFAAFREGRAARWQPLSPDSRAISRRGLGILALVGDAGGQQAILAVRNLEVVYGAGIVVVRRVSLTVPSGSVVALLGANGAGKTTLLRAISGLLPMHRGHIVTGTIEFGGERVERMSAPDIVRRGMAQVLEGRRIFAELSVDENLRAGAFTRRDRAQVRETYDSVMTMFPVLAQRRTATAGYLSGGEQQMLAIGRALMAGPRLLLLDEPSLGLAPLVVQQIRDIIAEINRAGTSVLLVEQNATMALSIAHHGYVLQNGRVAKHGDASELLADEEVREFYLGVGEGGRRSFRDLKPRRGRWSA